MKSLGISRKLSLGAMKQGLQASGISFVKGIDVDIALGCTS